MVTQLGRLTEITDLRSIWPHEALDFTKWLAEEDNIALLSDAIGIEISVEEEESPVGSFSVDIFATEAGTDRKIIIENQLEDTNHDHLGKLITYASGKGADIIVWVVKKARDEHRAAIEWLNNRTDKELGFFLCEIKLFKIGDSAPAVKFEVVESPNDWINDIKKESANTPTLQNRLEYWMAFNDHAFSESNENSKGFAKEFNRRKPNTDAWMALSIGSSEYRIDLWQIRKRETLEVQFYIPNNNEIFNSLAVHKEDIETDMGDLALSWAPLEGKKASRISIEHPANFGDRSDWPNQFDWLITTAIRMKRVFCKYLH